MSALVTLLLAAAASGTPAAAAPPAAQTVQQLFDEATEAANSGDCAKAVPLFEGLEKRQVLKAGSLPDAAVSARKGRCLVALGRVAEGEAAIRRGLPVLEKAGEEFTPDISDSLQSLGDAAFGYYDYDAAIAAYQRALTFKTGDARIYLLARLARASAFDGGTAPLGYTDEGIALASANPKPNKDTLAALHTLKGRILLNQGRSQDGYAELKTALALSGGLTNKTSLDEAAMRGDLAMAASLIGRKDDARLYLAYTGAGRMGDAVFHPGLSMDPPLCGDETGLRREDVAVVDFSIADDGSVRRAATIYTLGNRAVAAAFARAVNGWYWAPEAIAKIPPFHRAMMRVEMRCSTSGGGQPAIGTPALGRFTQWAGQQLPEIVPIVNDRPALVARLRTIVDGGRPAGNAAADVAALGLLASYGIGADDTRVGLFERALARAETSGQPAEVMNWLRLGRILQNSDLRSDRRRTALIALAQQPAVAEDPLIADTAKLLAAGSNRGVRQSADPSLARQVADDARLAEHHPLRQAARLMLANMAAASGDMATAQAHFASTGLSEQQCALIGPKPALRKSGVGSEDFPMEALRMGFEGWVNLEFDITADGRTTAARPVIAYPPLIFVDAASRMTKDLRYETSYRPTGGAACSANRENIHFAIPQNH